MLKTFKGARSLAWLQQGALEASGDKLGDIDRGQASSSIPAWTGTVVFSPTTDHLRDLNEMCIPILILLLQISDGSYGLGVKAHTSKCIQGPSKAHTSKHIQCLSRSTCLLMLHVEKRRQGFPQALTNYCAEVQVSLESAWPCSWVEAREFQDILGPQHLLHDRST